MANDYYEIPEFGQMTKYYGGKKKPFHLFRYRNGTGSWEHVKNFPSKAEAKVHAQYHYDTDANDFHIVKADNKQEAVSLMKEYHPLSKIYRKADES